MRVASWNVNLFNTNRRWDKLRLLELEDWDVSLLQEVTPETFDVFTAGTGFDGVAGHDVVEGEWTRRSHGVVVLVRRPWTLSGAAVILVDDEPRIRPAPPVYFSHAVHGCRDLPRGRHHPSSGSSARSPIRR